MGASASLIYKGQVTQTVGLMAEDEEPNKIERGEAREALDKLGGLTLVGKSPADVKFRIGSQEVTLDELTRIAERNLQAVPTIPMARGVFKATKASLIYKGQVTQTIGLMAEDKEPNKIERGEAREALDKLGGLTLVGKSPADVKFRIGPSEVTLDELTRIAEREAPATIQPRLPAAPTPAASDPREPYFDYVQKLFKNEGVYQRWRAYVEKKGLNAGQIRSYGMALKEIVDKLGQARFQQLLTSPYNNNPQNIIVAKSGEVSPGRGFKGPNPAFHGFTLVKETTPGRLKKAAWDHAGDLGLGKIETPYTTCSEIVRRMGANRAIVRIEIDIPGPWNDVTLNDSKLSEDWGALGWEVRWDGLDDKEEPWKCLTRGVIGSDKGTTIYPNRGHHRSLPIDDGSFIYWYATHSKVSVNPTDGQATGALRDNMKAFVNGAKGRFGN